MLRLAVATVLAGGVAVATLAGCSDRAGNAAPSPARPAVPVTVAEVVKKPMPLQVTAVGNAQAITSVAVKSQVAGQIVQVHFSEGQEVRRGDLLFTIDPRPFEAALRQAEANVTRDRAQLRQAEAALVQRQAEVQQAEANLARDTAQVENARVQERRYRELVDKEFVAREQYDQVRTNAAALEATVRADRAAVENAKAALLAAQAAVDNARAVIRADEAMVDAARLQLGYTTIRAPMDGRTGNLLVHPGNVVKANEDNPLVVINQVRPIYVSFAVPEQYLEPVKRYREAGALRVEVTAPDGREPIGRGELTFINNAVDPTTGTVQLKATVTNRDNALWPGQFVDVLMTLATEEAIVVPTPAIQSGQKGAFVYVVKADSTVEARPVEPGRRVETETIVVRGLTPGERVVTDGQLRLAPGAKVEVKSRPS